jgi:hypothetical protein
LNHLHQLFLNWGSPRTTNKFVDNTEKHQCN